MEEDKIKEIAKKVEAGFEMGGLIGGIYEEFAIQIAKEYASYIREKTIEECIGCVPKEIEKPRRECINAEMHTFGRCFDCTRNDGFNDCRQQTLKELSNLKK